MAKLKLTPCSVNRADIAVVACDKCGTELCAGHAYSVRFPEADVEYHLCFGDYNEYEIAKNKELPIWTARWVKEKGNS